MEDTKQNSKLKNQPKIKTSMELLVVFALCVTVFAAASYYDAFEKIVDFIHEYENLDLDEFFIVAIFLLFVLIFISFRQWHKISISGKELLYKNKELQKTLSEIKQLRGIIPICASCKKIRDDSGFWQQVEVYVRDHTDADFSHGICPDCAKNLYPELSCHVESRITQQK